MKSSTAAVPKERKPRSFWFDPRFAIGLGLVVVSVFGVLGIVASGDSSVQVFAARSALVPGDRIGAADLLVKSVRLGDLDGKYLVPADVPSGGLVVTRVVSAGELVPASAVGDRSGARVASVVVAVQGSLPKSVAAGAVIDIWSASRADDRSYGPPSVLASSVTVVRVIAPDGMVSAKNGDSVEVLVPRSRIARVLQAIANQDAISLVPANLPVKG
jgi:flagella basal body P-ring formation protein FlgA